MTKRYLPIGTVVKLKKADKLAMIAGYFPKGVSREGYVWDYSGFPYPEGMIDNDKVLQFDNESIEKVIVMGYQDELQMQFMRAVINKADEIKSGGKKDSAPAETGNEDEDKDSEVTE